MPAAGTWTLRIQDNGSGAVGTLHCWQMDVLRREVTCAEPAPPYTMLDAVAALQIAGGLADGTSAEIQTRLDFIDPIGVDLADVPHILRRVQP